MSRAQGLMLPIEIAYHRRVLFALELLDAITLERVYQGVSVVAEGLHGKPVLNSGGLFVWLQEDFARLRRLVIEPGLRPYQRVELLPAQVTRPLTRVELTPSTAYPFATGMTGVRGTLAESRPLADQEVEPVGRAEVRLMWLDQDGAWQEGRVISRTDQRSGDFASMVRLTAADRPDLDESGLMTMRVRVARENLRDRISE